MIVVEGPDGSGKSTLIRQLAEKFPVLELAPDSQLPPEERKKLKDRKHRQVIYTGLANAMIGNLPPRAHDRFFFSHLVYQPLMGAKVELTQPEVKMVRLILNALRAPIIMCLPPLEVVKANVEKSDQMKGVKELTAQIYEAYVHIGPSTSPGGGPGNQGGLHDIQYYDYTGTMTGSGSSRSLDQLYKIVEQFLSLRKERTWQS